MAAADTQVQVSSTTGFTPLPSTSVTMFALIDREIARVLSVNTTNRIVQLSRGQLSTRATPHVSGAVFTYLPAQASVGYVPSGQCLRTSLQYVPMVTFPSQGLSGSDVGLVLDCLGVGASGQWTITAPSLGNTVIGSVVASATSITPTGTYFQVSGTVNPVNTITVPAGWISGSCLTLEPTGAFVTGTGGNISIASTAVTGKMLFMCWNGVAQKWNPSY